MTVLIILAFVSYLLGAIPFGKIIGNTYGVDIQKEGSKNIGFANVYRVLGRKPAIFVLSCDILKGYIPTILACLAKLSVFEIFIIGIVAIIGHIFPVWLKFKGGKGVATSLGFLLALSPGLAIIGILSWFVVLTWTKMFSLASLFGAWIVFLSSVVVHNTRIYSTGILFMVILGTILHIENIKRIILRKEPKSWKW